MFISPGLKIILIVQNLLSKTVPIRGNSQSIEDIVPFPESAGSGIDVPRTASSSSSNSDDSLTDTLNDDSCQSGTCSYQQRQKCAGLLRFVTIY